MKSLLWINEADAAESGQHEINAAKKRQWVMIDYLEKQQSKDTRREVRQSRPPNIPDRTQKLTIKPKRSKRRSSPSKVDKVAAAAVTLPEPAVALVNVNDQQAYQAAWFHALRPAYTAPWRYMSWRNRSKIEFNHAFWDFARQDETLLEMFKAFAVAKEAAVKGCDYGRRYWYHVGKTLQMLNEDLEREGESLRLGGAMTICVLSQAACVEADFVSAEAHISVGVTFLKDRLHLIASRDASLYVAWTDLRLTAINCRPPKLPYYLHPEMRVPVPAKVKTRALTLARCRVRELPLTFSDEASDTIRPCLAVLTNAKAHILFARLYELAAAYNDDYNDVNMAWGVSYKVAYFLAQLGGALQEVRCGDPCCECDLVCVIITAARMEYWGLSSTFFPQSDLQKYMLEQFMAEVLPYKPSDLYKRWTQHGTAESLLWALSNVCTAIVHRHSCGIKTEEATMTWVGSMLKILVSRLGLSSCKLGSDALEEWPCSLLWLEKFAYDIYQWAITGTLEVRQAHEVAEGVLGLFADLRLPFDIMEE